MSQPSSPSRAYFSFSRIYAFGFDSPFSFFLILIHVILILCIPLFHSYVALYVYHLIFLSSPFLHRLLLPKRFFSLHLYLRPLLVFVFGHPQLLFLLSLSFISFSPEPPPNFLAGALTVQTPARVFT